VDKIRTIEKLNSRSQTAVVIEKLKAALKAMNQQEGLKIMEELKLINGHYLE